MRMVNSSFNEFAINKRLDLYPKVLFGSLLNISALF